MLSCTNLALNRGGRRLVEGVGFTLLPGALLHLRGANGVGKTTLLHALAGLIKPQQGELSFSGTPVWGDMDYRAEAAFLPHRPDMSGTESVREHLRTWGKLYGTLERLKPSAGFWGLEAVAEQPVRTLSAGWQQRVAMARLMLKPALVWLLDEPAAHLDEEGRNLFWKLLVTRANRNGIVVMTSHEIHTPVATAQTLDLDAFRALPEEGLAA